MISFNVPLPADYGGVIGVFYHLKALKQLGVEVILHCYQYGGRAAASELEDYAKEVHYYPRDMSLGNLMSSLPFIVRTRKHPALLERLLEDDYPILFEGTHVCKSLSDSRLADRIKIVRMHNVEWQYYKNMASIEKDFKKRMFFEWESRKLKKFETETIKNHADIILAVSPAETEYFKENGFLNVEYVSAFHPNEAVSVLPGKGDYSLFQGDLSVKENQEAAFYLAEKVFSKIPEHKLVIAGRQPSKELSEMINRFENVELRRDLSFEEMEGLIKNAQINILVAFQAAGMKLKLLNALYKGRHCLVNSPMVVNTGLDSLCTIRETPETLAKTVKELMETPFQDFEIRERERALNEAFSNVGKARKWLRNLDR